jgi:hypothetical protein
MTVFPLFLDSIQTQERPGMLISFRAFEPPLSREVQQMHHFKQKLYIQTKGQLEIKFYLFSSKEQQERIQCESGRKLEIDLPERRGRVSHFKL